MAPYVALYGRRCLSPVVWFETGEARLLGTYLVRDTLEKVKLIQDRLCIAESRQKSYADRKARNVAFMADKQVLLWVSPMKGAMRFGKKGKLNPRYIGPFEILERVGEVAYKLALPTILSTVHPVFHVSMLQKYYSDPSHVLDFSLVQLEKNLAYIEEPVAILDKQIQKLKSKSIASVKIQWREIWYVDAFGVAFVNTRVAIATLTGGSQIFPKTVSAAIARFCNCEPSVAIAIPTTEQKIQVRLPVLDVSD
ncbi:uncharacterized protein [Nicotiana tomentosiformis]|uniref:uncharacterized protein n=1 Tax=Nicotiana tomentosiformis TaxID=4098 RepID=UPI00388C9ABA